VSINLQKEHSRSLLEDVVLEVWLKAAYTTSAMSKPRISPPVSFDPESGSEAST